MKPSLFSILMAAAFLIAACTADEPDRCISYTLAPVTKVEGPSIGTITQPLNMEISFGIYNGCGNFSGFDITWDNDTAFVKVKAKYEGCICTQVAAVFDTTYTFTSSTAGTYYFRYYQDGTSFIRDTITIQ